MLPLHVLGPLLLVALAVTVPAVAWIALPVAVIGFLAAYHRGTEPRRIIHRRTDPWRAHEQAKALRIFR